LQPIGADHPVIPVNKAYIVSDLHVDTQYHPESVDLTTWEHLRGINISSKVDINSVAILIGENVPIAHAVLESRYSKDPHSQPYAVRTPLHALGWCVAGPTQGEQASVDVNFVSLNQTGGSEIRGGAKEMALMKAVEKLWQVEKHGFENTNVKMMSAEDRQSLIMLEDGTRQTEDGHYEIGLLWRKDNSVFPDDKPLAEKRLASLKKRFAKDPEYETMNRKAMDANFQEGYARILTPEQVASTSDRTWYLPHHGVMNINKPGRVRVVFDAAAEYRGTSLNKELRQGPDFNNGLLGVLMRFREHRIAITADIQAMFSQFKVPADDCKSLGFLWWKDGLEEDPAICQMTRHIFGATDSPSACTFGMRCCAEDHSGKYDPSVSKAVHRSFYVNDFLKSVSEVGVAILLSLGLIALLEEGRLKLTKFVSNSTGVLNALPGEVRATGHVDLDLDTEATERALGVKWNVESKIKSSLNRPNDIKT
jgi:hypothetical protein